jgi:hypothetical protein
MVFRFQQPRLLQQSQAPETPQPGTAEQMLGALLSGTVEGGIQDFTKRRSGRKIEEILSDPNLDEGQKISKLSTTPGIRPQDIQNVAQNLQFQQQLGAKQQQTTISPQGLRAIQKAQTGEELTAEDFINVPENEIKIALRAQETAGVTGGEIQKEFLKSNIKFGEELASKTAEAKRLSRGLDVLEDLVRSGSTDNKIRNFLGQNENLRWLMDPGSVAFLSGIKDQFADFKETFGARPTQYEAKIFEKGLPSLMASREGKLAAVFMQKAKREAFIAKKKAFDEINKEVGFKPTTGDFKQRVEEKADREVDKIYDKLKTKLFGLIEKQKKVSPKNVLLKNEATGETLEVPKGSIKKFEKFGWSRMR